MKKIVMVLGLMLMMVAISAPSQAKVYKGTYQKNTKWRYNTKTKKLVIAAKGKIKEEINRCDEDDGPSIEMPWKKWKYEIKEVELKKGVTELPDLMFIDYRKMQKISLPEGLKCLGNSSFAATYKLKKIRLPKSVKKIGWDCFLSSGIRKINLKNIKSIGTNAFCGAKLTCVTIRKYTKYGKAVYGGCSNLKKAKIQEGVKKISDYMFNIPNMESIVIPKSVTSIGKYVFFQYSTDHCKLKKVTIKSKNIKHWGKDIFGEPSEGMQIIVPKEKLKEYKKALRKNGLPAHVKVIGKTFK